MFEFLYLSLSLSLSFFPFLFLHIKRNEIDEVYAIFIIMIVSSEQMNWTLILSDQK